jgi:hypothetical protein
MIKPLILAVTAVMMLNATTLADRLADRNRTKEKRNSEYVQKSKLRFGLMGGLVAGGMAHVEGYDFELLHADSWEGFVDLPTAHRLVPRLSLDLHKVSPERYHRSRYLYDLSLGLIYKERASKRGFGLHPGVSLGYGRISDETFGISGDFFMFKMHLDLLWFFRPAGPALFTQVGMVAAPVGRSVTGEKVSADFRPLLRFGFSI